MYIIRSSGIPQLPPPPHMQGLYKGYTIVLLLKKTRATTTKHTHTHNKDRKKNGKLFRRGIVSEREIIRGK